MAITGTRTENAVRNITWAAVNKAVSMVLPFLTQTAMVYCMGDLYWGLDSLFTSVLQVLSLAELGAGSAIAFSMYKPMAEDDIPLVQALLGFYKKVYRIIGSAILAVGLLLTPFIPHLVNGETPAGVNLYVVYLVQLANTSIGYFLYGYRGALLMAGQKAGTASKISTGVSILAAGMKIAALVLMRNYYLYCLTLPLAAIITNIATKRATDKLFPEYTKEGGGLPDAQKKAIKSRVSGLFLHKICGVTRSSFDSIAISMCLGLTQLGFYQRYYTVMNSVSGFLAAIPNAATAEIGNSIATEPERKNYRDFLKFQFLYMWLSCWAVSCLYCLYQPFMAIWVGEGRMLPDKAMAIFCVYFFTARMGDMCFQYRQAAGLWHKDKLRPVMESIVNLALNFTLVGSFGISGVLISTIICLVLINAGWGSRVLYRNYFAHEKQRYYFLRLIGYAAMAASACAVTSYVCSFVPFGGIPGLAAKAAICVTVPNLCIAMAAFLFPERKDALEFCMRKIRKSIAKNT